MWYPSRGSPNSTPLFRPPKKFCCSISRSKIRRACYTTPAIVECSLTKSNCTTEHVSRRERSTVFVKTRVHLDSSHIYVCIESTQEYRLCFQSTPLTCDKKYLGVKEHHHPFFYTPTVQGFINGSLIFTHFFWTKKTRWVVVVVVVATILMSGKKKSVEKTSNKPKRATNNTHTLSLSLFSFVFFLSSSHCLLRLLFSRFCVH